MKPEDFRRRLEAGEGIMSILADFQVDYSHTEPRRVAVDFPAWMVESLDREAKRLGVTRQSVIKIWVADRLNELPHSQLDG